MFDTQRTSSLHDNLGFLLGVAGFAALLLLNRTDDNPFSPTKTNHDDSRSRSV